MQGYLAGGSFSGGDVGCLCAVCRRYNRSAVRIVEQIHKKYDRLFVDGIERDDPVYYSSILKSSNDKDLEKIRGTVSLDFVDGRSILECPASSSDKFMVAIATLLTVVLASFIIFAILVCRGDIHVSGVNLEVVNNVTGWVGTGLCMASFSYLLLGLGYLVGFRTESNSKRSKSVVDSCESKLKKCAIIQKKIDSSLSRCREILQLRASDLKLAVTVPSVYGGANLSVFMKRYLNFGELSREVELKLESINSEIADIRDDSRLRYNEICLLVQKNKELSEENDILISKLDEKNCHDDN